MILGLLTACEWRGDVEINTVEVDGQVQAAYR